MLNSAVRELLGRQSTATSIQRLKSAVRHAAGPFVWEAIDLDACLVSLLPTDIRSAWIFVLKRDTPSQGHFHPHSVQHMVMLEGMGTAYIGGSAKEMVGFDQDADPHDVWEVIDAGVTHEFLPHDQDMVVMSFHTCGAQELIEIDAATGRQRTYEEPAHT
jgi:hypothetical protein